MGLKRKNTSHIRATQTTDRFRRPTLLRKFKEIQTVESAETSSLGNIESLEKYRLTTKKYQASLTFSGEAGEIMRELMSKLEVDSPNEVVLRAITLLVSAQGKEILLRDAKTGALEAVEV